MKSLLFVSVLSLALNLGASAQARRLEPPANANALKNKLYRLIHENPNLQGAKVGVYVQVLKTGRVVFNDHGAQPMIPASNLKVVTTAVALDTMGPDFRYQTELRGEAPDKSGIMPGDLYLRGSGDPTLVFPYNDPRAPWRFFARTLKSQGVKRIEGDIVGDDSAFDREFLGQGWYDRYLLDGYAAPVSALSMNANVAELTITNKGVRWDPPSKGFKVVNQVKAGGYDDLYVTRDRNSDVTFVKGTIVPGSVVKRGVTIPNPSMFTVGSFTDYIVKAGIPVGGVPRLIRDFGEPAQARQARLIARYQSPKLREIIAQVNKESDNLFANHVFKSIGQKARGYGSAQNAEVAVREFFRKNGLDDTNFVMVDGSGLSTLNRITPRQLVGVLEIMYRHKHGQVFVDSLPSNGEGTMTSRLGGVTVRAKTGTLDGHSSLTGYVISGYGQTLGFSVVVNDIPNTWPAIELEDRIVRTLATWGQPL